MCVRGGEAHQRNVKTIVQTTSHRTDSRRELWRLEGSPHKRRSIWGRRTMDPLRSSMLAPSTRKQRKHLGRSLGRYRVRNQPLTTHFPRSVIRSSAWGRAFHYRDMTPCSVGSLKRWQILHPCAASLSFSILPASLTLVLHFVPPVSRSSHSFPLFEPLANGCDGAWNPTRSLVATPRHTNAKLHWGPHAGGLLTQMRRARYGLLIPVHGAAVAVGAARIPHL